MARKDLLKGLMTAAPSAVVETKSAPPKLPGGNQAPRAAIGGAIGAVGRSVADLKARAVVEVDPRMIDGAGLEDRLDAEDADLAMLTASIRAHGQQVPVLLRLNPNDQQRYEVVYGRRRVAALRELGRPVRALVRDLDDAALVLAQGQENSQRKNLSFIERANFARQMRDGGYGNETIRDALAVDKSGLSKLLAVADRVPAAVIRAIGAAPSFGRDRWLKLADASGDTGQGALMEAARGETSDERFSAVMAFLAAPRRSPKPARVIPGDDGVLARMRMAGGRAQITVEDARFGEWLAAQLPHLHRDWSDTSG